MKTSKCLLVTLSLFLYCGLSFAADGQGFVENDFVLNAQQKQELTNQALDGSGQAALRLSRFYSNVTLNLDEALRWAIIGAENGDPNCEYTAYGFLDRRRPPAFSSGPI
jgi:hypothetical protein